MSQLTHLKRRIQSIKTTEKITHAMRLIAMSLYSKLDKEREALDSYKKAVAELFHELTLQCPTWKNEHFFPQDPLDSQPLLIVISSTKGFCGGLNNNLFKYIDYKLFIEEHQSPHFVTLGKKATEFIKEKDLGPIIESYVDLNSNNFPDIAKKIADLILAQTPAFSSVSIYSSLFKNFFSQKPSITKILPVEHEEEDTACDIEPIWEQDRIEIVNTAASTYLNTQLTHMLFQSLIAEYAARFVAMDGATSNAEKYLEALTLQFNKMRQALITREVSELSANM